MIKLNELNCSDLDLTFPRRGAWVASINLPSAGSLKIGNSVTLTVDSFTFVGTVYAIDTKILGHAVVNAIGGKGGVQKLISAKNYGAGPSVAQVIKDIFSQNGETLSSTSDSQAVNARLATWQTFKDIPSGEQLTRLVQEQGAVWRITDAGEVQVTIDTFSTTTQLPTSAILSSVSPPGTFTYEVPVIDKLPRPGTSNASVRINEVKVLATATKTRIILRDQQLGDTLANLSRLGQRFGAIYPCSVVRQNSDGTLQLNPDDSSIKGSGLDNVKIIYGIPGMTATVEAGTRVMLGYSVQDANRPFVYAFDGPDGLLVNTIGDPDSAQFVALASLIVTQLSTLKSAISSGFTAVGAGAAANGATGASTFNSALTAWPGNMAATKLKTE